MSAARRSARKGRPAEQKRRRLFKRRTLACRATHWPTLLKNASVSDLRRPYDQLCRVALLRSPCRRCRISPQIPVVIDEEEELQARGPEALTRLLSMKLLSAHITFARISTPYRVRREVESVVMSGKAVDAWCGSLLPQGR